MKKIILLIYILILCGCSSNSKQQDLVKDPELMNESEFGEYMSGLVSELVCNSEKAIKCLGLNSSSCAKDVSKLYESCHNLMLEKYLFLNTKEQKLRFNRDVGACIAISRKHIRSEWPVEELKVCESIL